MVMVMVCFLIFFLFLIVAFVLVSLRTGVVLRKNPLLGCWGCFFVCICVICVPVCLLQTLSLPGFPDFLYYYEGVWHKSRRGRKVNLAIAAFLLGSTNMCIDLRMFRMVRKETVYEQRTGIKKK